jgi:SNF2 family DNA or RNA helicase
MPATMLQATNIDKWLDWYHAELSKKPGYEGERLHQYQQDAIKQLINKFGEHYPRYVRLMSEKPPEPTTKAARERWEYEMRELIAQFGYLIAWDMGLGKSSYMIVATECLHHFFPKLFDDGGQFPLPTLIICQKSTLNQIWLCEIKRWSTKSANRDLLVVPTGVADAKRALMMIRFIRPFFVVTTYDTLRCRLQQFKELPFGIIIVDEIHHYKHSAAKRSQALYQIQSKVRIGLGGTPTTNRPNDLHAILAWLQGYTIMVQESNGSSYPIRRSSTWGSYADFVETYCEIENGYHKKIIGGKNLTPKTCQLCRNSRCSNGCRYQYWESSWRRKYCVDCPRDLPPVCDICDMALHPRMTKLVMSRLRADEINTLEPYRIIEVHHEFTLAQIRLYKQIQAGYVAYISKLIQGESEVKIANVLAQWNYAKALCVDVRVLARFIENREQRIAKTNGYSLMDYVHLTTSRRDERKTE